MYGLRKALRAWYSKIDGHFLSQVFVRSSNEQTLYRKLNSEGGVLIVCLYVDDIVYFGSSQSLIDKFRSVMNNAFEMPDLG